jgi:NADH dehydrogenase
MDSDQHRIAIVGGGAAGVELATRLGDTMGKHRRAQITLIEKSRTHLWKPLLHAVAAGSMNPSEHELNYLAQAHWHHFQYRFGEMTGLDRGKRQVRLAATVDEEGREITAPRSVGYDTLVIAIGSVANTFGVPGVEEHAYALESAAEADRFHRRLINACIQANYQSGSATARLRVVIVGGGATGVELAAELHNTTRVLAAYGLENIEPERFLQITLLDAGGRILPMLPERISKAVTAALEDLGVRVACSEQVSEITATEVRSRSGRSFPADLTVWAAGIKGAEVLRNLDGLETNRINQLVVLPTLQTTRDPDIFALGDCSVFPREGGRPAVPPAAQAAHQQASHLLGSIALRLDARPLAPFHYRDFGSLVSLGEYSTIGSLMGFLSGRSYRVEGWFARFMYLSLYKLHLYALHGPVGVILDSLARFLKRGTEPRVKLH